MAKGGTRIRIVQQGGFAGPIEQLDIDSHALTPPAAAEIERARAELTGLRHDAETRRPAIGADLPHYLVEIEHDGGSESFRLDEPAAETASLAPAIGAIVKRLRRLARG